MNKQFPKRQEPPQTSVGVKLLTAGTAACWADFVTFPLDTAKVRLQVSTTVLVFRLDKELVYLSNPISCLSMGSGMQWLILDMIDYLCRK